MKEENMDFAKVPIGFGMELAQDEMAMQRYSSLTQEEKRAVLKRAHNARSEKEMRKIVADLSNRAASYLQDI